MGGRLEEGRPMERFGLRNDQWDRIKDFLPGREGHVGGTAEDNRLFVEAVLYRFRTGWVASESWLELKGRSLREHQNIDSSGEVNRLIDKLGGDRLPSVN